MNLVIRSIFSCIAIVLLIYTFNIFINIDKKLFKEQDKLADIPEINNHQITVNDVPENEINDEEYTLDFRKDENGIIYIQSNDIKENDQLGKIYKWKDENNTIIISMSPPDNNIDAEVFLFSREQRINNELNEPQSESISDNLSSDTFSFTENPLKVYTPSGLKELIEYSHSVGEKIELREKELNDLINQL